MTRGIHEQARELIALAGIEGGTEDLSDAQQQTWLRAHLQECAACRDYAEAAGRAVRALRSQPLTADSALVREGCGQGCGAGCRRIDLALDWINTRAPVRGMRAG